MKAIGIDLGGTNIKGILMTGEGGVVKTLQTETNEKDEKHWKSAIRNMVQDLRAEEKNTDIPVGLSAPGLAGDNNDRIVLMPGRLAGLEHFIWSDFLQTPAWVLNDAHSALMCEATFGAGKGYKDVVMLTLGTGVGGGVMINGVLHQGLLNRAGHLGHITLNADADFFDVTNMPASLEEIIGNCSIERRSLGRYSSTYHLVQDYKKGDVFAVYTWLHSVKRLSVALSAFINIISPQIIILGGGIAEAGEDLFGPLRSFMDVFEWYHADVRTPVLQATFNEYSGAAGAAAFALHKTKTS
ncbi:MAG: ROK family protein [Chitinophagaceae bacterium]|nr:ROK family protein [Chitinophagaceae bacterium]